MIDNRLDDTVKTHFNVQFVWKKRIWCTI